MLVVYRGSRRFSAMANGHSRNYFRSLDPVMEPQPLVTPCNDSSAHRTKLFTTFSPSGPYSPPTPIYAEVEHHSIGGNETRLVHVPIVPMSVKAPVAVSMLYIETLLEPEFVT